MGADVTEDVPQGKLYADLYEPPNPPKEDDERFRVRLAAVLKDQVSNYDIEGHVRREMGLAMPWDGSGPNVNAFLKAISQRDLLHFITQIARLINANAFEARRHHRAESGFTAGKWVTSVARVLREQNMAWRVDPMGGVHPIRDQIVLAERAAVLEGLAKPRYANIRHEVELSIETFDDLEHPNPKLAVRHVFQAAEGLFRLMFNGTERLTASAVRSRLKSAVNREGDNREAAMAAESLTESFAKWADALQPYRHEPGIADIVHQPPADLATVMISQGLSYVRWLIGIDQKALTTAT